MPSMVFFVDPLPWGVEWIMSNFFPSGYRSDQFFDHYIRTMKYVSLGLTAHHLVTSSQENSPKPGLGLGVDVTVTLDEQGPWSLFHLQNPTIPARSTARRHPARA